MIILTHRIADIVFRTETNIRLPRIHDELFEKFRVPNDTPPDILQRILKLTSDQAADDETASSGDVAQPASPRHANPLLRFKPIAERVDACLRDTELVTLAIDEFQITIRDFSTLRFDYFYSDDLWGYDPQRQVKNADFFVGSNIRRIYLTFLPYFDAVLVHSSGVIRNNKAALFLAPSYGGKSTVAQLAGNAPVLSDDQIILRQMKDGLMAHATPLGRVSAGPHAAPVGAFFLLEKAADFDISPIDHTDALEFLWANKSSETYFFPRKIKRQSYTVMFDASRPVPTYRMRFPKDYVDWDAIDKAMNAG